jgi:BREX protein BrxB
VAFLDRLIAEYTRSISAPWLQDLPGSQRMFFVVYPKEHERKLRAKRDVFALATRESGHAWHTFDFTPVFPEWMAASEYRDYYFDSPADLSLKLESEFVDYAAERLRSVLTAPDVDASTVVGVFGAGTLYGFARLSRVLHAVEREVRGRLVVFFPGHHESSNYRLLDSRDGWNYLAIPITVSEGGFEL